jgi:hypothetical protein
MMRLLLLCATATTAAAEYAETTTVEPWGTDAIRVRVSAPHATSWQSKPAKA